MSAPKHTAGPWRVEGGESDASTPILADGVIIASAHSYKPRAIDRRHPDRATRDANARLIAAAPKLLAALMWLVKHPRCQASYTADSEMARRVDRAVTAILEAGVTLPDDWPPAPDAAEAQS